MSETTIKEGTAPALTPGERAQRIIDDNCDWVVMKRGALHNLRGDIVDHITAAVEADRVAERLLAVLDKQRVVDDLCECYTCAKSILAATSDFKCDLCGYVGAPVAAACACYEYPCSGGTARGMGCFHGALCCPVCSDGDGDLSGWDVIQELRRVLAASAAPSSFNSPAAQP